MTKTSESSAGDAMTRSEEELQVRTTQRESVRVRCARDMTSSSGVRVPCGG